MSKKIFLIVETYIKKDLNFSEFYRPEIMLTVWWISGAPHMTPSGCLNWWPLSKRLPAFRRSSQAQAVMRELLLWRLPVARTEPSAYLAQAKLATQTSWGGHLGPSLDPPPVPSPGTGGGKGHQNGAEETFTWWTQVLAFSPLLPRGSEWKPLWYGQVWNPPRAHENQVTGKYYLYVSTHTWGSQPWAHTQHQHLDSVHQAPYPHPPSTNMLVSQQKTYLQILVRCVYIWQTNLSLEGTSHLNKRAQSHKEKPYWWS